MFLVPLSVVTFKRHLFSAQSQDQQEIRPAAAETTQQLQIKGGTKIEAELETALDTRTAKPGDVVAARVAKDVKEQRKTVIRKGDSLLGRVEKVEHESLGAISATVVVTFDRLEQGGSTIQLNTVVSSVLSAPHPGGFVRREENEEAAPAGGGTRPPATPLEFIRVAPRRAMRPHSATSFLSAQLPQLRLESGTFMRFDVVDL